MASAHTPPENVDDDHLFDDELDMLDSENAEEELDEKPKSILLELIKQVKLGSDLSRVTLPTFVLEPRSLLERSTDFASHPDYMFEALEENDPLQRLLKIVRWQLSGWHLRPKGVKKPYNPILGEVFRCSWDHDDGSTTTFLAEQVSHHPPCSAYWCENRKKQYAIEGQYYPRSKFLGNSAASLFEGYFRIHLLGFDEVYDCTLPNIYARGILFGKLRMELSGKTYIACEETGYYAEIEFKEKGMFKGAADRVVGKIKHINEKHALYEISGKWTDVMYIKNCATKHEEVFLDVRTAVKVDKAVPSVKEQLDHESRRLWRYLTLNLKKGNFDEATKVKSEIEEFQRKLRKEREANSVHWQPTHFHEAPPGSPGAPHFPHKKEKAKHKEKFKDWQFNGALFDKYDGEEPAVRDLFEASESAGGSKVVVQKSSSVK